MATQSGMRNAGIRLSGNCRQISKHRQAGNDILSDAKDRYILRSVNDWFFLIFAIPGIACLAVGTMGQMPVWTCIGLGITLYGACYFFVHDLFIHQRLKVLRNSNNRYLKAIRRAHKVHHKHLGKEDGECFGMLWVPLKYFKEKRSDQAT